VCETAFKRETAVVRSAGSGDAPSGPDPDRGPCNTGPLPAAVSLSVCVYALLHHLLHACDVWDPVWKVS
jgi:hypothetical protein